MSQYDSKNILNLKHHKKIGKIYVMPKQNKFLYSFTYFNYLISSMTQLQNFMRHKQYKQDNYQQAVNDSTELNDASPINAQLYKLKADEENKEKIPFIFF